MPGLDTGQLKLLCLVAYLGDIPGDYVLKQLYGRNRSKAKTDLGILEHSRYMQDGRVSPRVFFDVVAVALDNFDIPRWVEKTCQFRMDTASWLWKLGTALHGQDAAALRGISRPSFLRADLGEYLGERLLDAENYGSLFRLLTEK